jgi:beta-lactamase class A
VNGGPTDRATDPAAVAERIRAVWTAAGTDGFLHAREVDGARELSVDADEPVVLASVFKIPVALEYARQAAAGEVDRAEPVRITGRDKDGGVGTSGCADDVDLSLRDAVRFMLTMSDNAATDVVLRRVGLDNVHTLLDSLGLHRTRLIGGCADLLGTIRTELGITGWEELAGIPEERIRAVAALDPARTTAGTPREITTLLALIWRDEAAPPAACKQVREMMYEQLWPHRLSSGFPDEVRVGGKTGTLNGVRNEAGVVEYPDGRRYAVSVFLRPHSLAIRLPAVDAAIGAGARLAVDHLRAAR